MDMKAVIDTAAAIGILSDFFDKGGEGAEVVQRGAPAAAASAPALVPVLSYKQRLAQMKAAAAAAPPTGKAPRARRGC